VSRFVSSWSLLCGSVSHTRGPVCTTITHTGQIHGSMCYWGANSASCFLLSTVFSLQWFSDLYLFCILQHLVLLIPASDALREFADNPQVTYLGISSA
jgi:hypothetical protein